METFTSLTHQSKWTVKRVRLGIISLALKVDVYAAKWTRTWNRSSTLAQKTSTIDDTLSSMKADFHQRAVHFPPPTVLVLPFMKRDTAMSSVTGWGSLLKLSTSRDLTVISVSLDNLNGKSSSTYESAHHVTPNLCMHIGWQESGSQRGHPV